MMYANENVKCYDNEAGCVPQPQQTENLAEMMNKGMALANEVLSRTYRINEHLFGFGEPIKDEKRPQPCCFRDVLSEQVTTLIHVYDELMKISERLGI